MTTYVENGDGRVLESEFQRLLQDEKPAHIGLLDNTPANKSGKPLNEMHISRQRAVLLSDEYMSEIKSKKAEEERRKKEREDEVSRLEELERAGNPEYLNVVCRNPGCNAEKPRLKNRQIGWDTCFHKGSTFQFCGKDACKNVLDVH